MNDEPDITFREKENDVNFDKGDVRPTAGGCWFCHKDDGNLKFDMEYDTFYHEKCLEKTGCDTIHEYEKRGYQE